MSPFTNHGASFLTSTAMVLPSPPDLSSSPTIQPSISNPKDASFALQKCTEEDMPRFFQLVSEAFGHSEPYIDAEFPKHDTSSGRAAGSKRFQNMFKEDRYATWLKVVNGNGEMVAGAKWNVYNGEGMDLESDLEGDWWETREDKSYAQHLSRVYLSNRRRKFREERGRLVVLEFMVVDPKYQSRGAGTMLTKWGSGAADRMGVKIVIEATSVGMDLYKKEGFKLVDDFELSLPEKWTERPRQRICWMIRSPKSGGRRMA